MSDVEASTSIPVFAARSAPIATSTPMPDRSASYPTTSTRCSRKRPSGRSKAWRGRGHRLLRRRNAQPAPNPRGRRLIDGLRERFDFAEDAEITMEANPESVDATNCAALHRAGVNRLSIGVQSFDDEELRFLGPHPRRDHGGGGVSFRACGGIREREPRPDLRAAGTDHGALAAGRWRRLSRSAPTTCRSMR